MSTLCNLDASAPSSPSEASVEEKRPTTRYWCSCGHGRTAHSTVHKGRCLISGCKCNKFRVSVEPFPRKASQCW